MKKSLLVMLLCCLVVSGCGKNKLSCIEEDVETAVIHIINQSLANDPLVLFGVREAQVVQKLEGIINVSNDKDTGSCGCTATAVTETTESRIGYVVSHTADGKEKYVEVYNI